MIDQISYSKQAAKEGGGPSENHILNAVRDADRVEALGTIGIQRCLTFIRSKDPVMDPLPPFIHHAYEKLLRLVSDGFIVTNVGKELASFVATILPVYPELQKAYPPPPFL